MQPSDNLPITENPLKLRYIDLTVKHYITQNSILSNFSLIQLFDWTTFRGPIRKLLFWVASVGTRKRAVIEKTLEVNPP